MVETDSTGDKFSQCKGEIEANDEDDGDGDESDVEELADILADILARCCSARAIIVAASVENVTPPMSNAVREADAASVAQKGRMAGEGK